MESLHFALIKIKQNKIQLKNCSMKKKNFYTILKNKFPLLDNYFFFQRSRLRNLLQTVT